MRESHDEIHIAPSKCGPTHFSESSQVTRTHCVSERHSHAGNHFYGPPTKSQVDETRRLGEQQILYHASARAVVVVVVVAVVVLAVVVVFVSVVDYQCHRQCLVPAK